MAGQVFRKAICCIGVMGGVVWLSFNAAMAADTTRAFSTQLEDLLTKKNELLLKRVELEEKWLEYANEIPPDVNGDSVNTRQGYTSSKVQERKIGRLMAEIKQVDRELDLLKDGRSVRQLVETYQRKDESQTRCEFGRCLQMLGQFLNLGSQISLINSKLLESELANLKSQSAHLKNAGSALELAIANVDLERLSYECERTLADLRYDSWLQPQGLAECFYSVTKENEQKFGAPHLKTGFGFDFDLYQKAAMSLKNPQTSIDEFSTGFEGAIADYVMTLPNYSVTPEVVFRKAYELSRGNMYVALRTLFNALRHERTNVDFQRKLIDIRGDRPQKGRNGGDWYHFFGTMLAEQIFGRWLAMQGLSQDTPTRDEKKTYHNRAGVETMARLEDLIEGKAKISKRNPCDLKYQLSKYPADEIKADD